MKQCTSGLEYFSYEINIFGRFDCGKIVDLDLQDLSCAYDNFV